MLPADLADSLSAALGGVRVLGASPVSGGMINRAARVETSEGPVFVKWPGEGGEASPLPGLYAAEADGLERLRAAPGGLRVPRVLAASDDPARTPFLTLEYVAPEAPVAFQDAFTRRFAEGLARQHHCRPDGGRRRGYGLGRDNYLGPEPQANGWVDDWPDFYAERRLLPQIDAARDRRPEMTWERERLLMLVVERLDDLLAGMPDEASLLHGDLWSGNFLHAAGDEPVLVDPAVYYGPREMEIAYVELFGGFPPGFVAAYRNVYPLDPGYERRRPLHQLWHLLVHWNLFGEPYGARCEEVCRLYVA